MTLQQLGRTLFEAYNAKGANPWKTWDGKDVPQWEQLTQQVREKWVAAALAACIAIGNDGSGG